MKINVLTLFPEMIENIARESILGRAIEAGHIVVNAVNIRDYTENKHNRVDDYTYGGGAGMLIQAQPVFDCFMDVTKDSASKRCIYVTPQGRPFTQRMAENLAEEEEITILCGHYEGIDERVLEEIVTDYVSIGDYVLTGGELAAMVVVDAVARLVPEVLGNGDSAEIESFHRNLLEYPQYTRPALWHDKAVPKELLAGDPKSVEKWRLEKSVERTAKRRPDLLEKHFMEEDIIHWLREFRRDYTYVIEPLRRGLLDIIKVDPGKAVYLRDPNCRESYIVCFSDEYDISDFLMEEYRWDEFCVSSKVLAEKVEKWLKKTDCLEFNVFTYTEKEKKGINPDHDIRRLDMSSFDYVFERYQEGGEDYVRKLIKHGTIYGYYLDGQLCAFIGKHLMGCTGVLHVDEKYRRKGLAQILEQFEINQALDRGETMYCFVSPDNEASLALQKKMGLYITRKRLYIIWANN